MAEEASIVQCVFYPLRIRLRRRRQVSREQIRPRPRDGAGKKFRKMQVLFVKLAEEDSELMPI